MSNMMPGDNSGAEPAEHERYCRTNCEFADVDLADGEACPEGHDDHVCTCDGPEEPVIPDDW
jgi:hypothetical protein